MEIVHLTAAQMGRLLRAGELTSEQISRAFLDRIAATNPAINAFISVAAERAIDRAKEFDRTRESSSRLSASSSSSFSRLCAGFRSR